MFNETCCQVWVNEIQARSTKSAPLATSTLPALSRDKLVEHINRLRTLWNQKNRPTVRQQCTEPKEVRRLLMVSDNIVDMDGVLYKKILVHGKRTEQLLLPKCLQNQVLQAVHDNAGHQGPERTFELANSRCYCMETLKFIVIGVLDALSRKMSAHKYGITHLQETT